MTGWSAAVNPLVTTDTTLRKVEREGPCHLGLYPDDRRAAYPLPVDAGSRSMTALRATAYLGRSLPHLDWLTYVLPSDGYPAGQKENTLYGSSCTYQGKITAKPIGLAMGLPKQTCSTENLQRPTTYF